MDESSLIDFQLIIISRELYTLIDDDNIDEDIIYNKIIKLIGLIDDYSSKIFNLFNKVSNNCEIQTYIKYRETISELYNVLHRVLKMEIKIPKFYMDIALSVEIRIFLILNLCKNKIDNFTINMTYNEKVHYELKSVLLSDMGHFIYELIQYLILDEIPSFETLLIPFSKISKIKEVIGDIEYLNLDEYLYIDELQNDFEIIKSKLETNKETDKYPFLVLITETIEMILEQK